jgi:hypothetical protein
MGNLFRPPAIFLASGLARWAEAVAVKDLFVLSLEQLADDVRNPHVRSVKYKAGRSAPVRAIVPRVKPSLARKIVTLLPKTFLLSAGSRRLTPSNVVEYDEILLRIPRLVPDRLQYL